MDEQAVKLLRGILSLQIAAIQKQNGVVGDLDPVLPLIAADFSHVEIAALVGTTPNAIKKRAQRARNKR